MEIEEVEAVLEKIWDLHDKFSDAVRSISRTHFLNSFKPLKRTGHPETKKVAMVRQLDDAAAEENRAASAGGGYFFVKEFGVYDEALQEAKSLNSICAALENMEDQLEFFHTVQLQQHA